VVRGPYRHEPGRGEQRHVRDVEWLGRVPRRRLATAGLLLPGLSAAVAVLELQAPGGPAAVTALLDPSRPRRIAASTTRAKARVAASLPGQAAGWRGEPRHGHRKVVLSRKGSDSRYGGFPGLVTADGAMITVPIPDVDVGTAYADLRAAPGLRLLAVLEAESRHLRQAWSGKIEHLVENPHLEAHLDPDLRRSARDRPHGFLPAFGQQGGAQMLLSEAGVGPGDLFLFFGWYARGHDGPAALRSKDGVHALWGWLEVAEVLTPAAEASLRPELTRHPHVTKTAGRSHNTIYTGAIDSSWSDGPGAGVFTWGDALRLTSVNQPSRSRWTLPACLHPASTRVNGLRARAEAWSSPRSGDTTKFLSHLPHAQWQEMIFETSRPIGEWVASLIEHGRGGRGPVLLR